MKNFKAFDYNTSFDILYNSFKNNTDKKGDFIIVVGANGSGKSTYIANLLKTNDIDIRYINADIVEKTLFSNIDDDKQRMITSMEYTKNIMEQAIENRQSVIYETVFSHPSKLDLVKKAIENGYNVKAIYIKTNNYNINISRVKKRASQGGHDVPEEKIISRYPRVLSNVKILEGIVDDFTVFDNSKEKSTVVLEKNV